MKNNVAKLLSINFILLGILFSGISFAASPKLTEVVVANADASSRILLTLTKPVKARVFTLANPNRLVVDLPRTLLNSNLKKIKLQKWLLKKVRSGYLNKDTLRLVFDLAQPVRVQASPPQKNLVLEIQPIHSLDSASSDLSKQFSKKTKVNLHKVIFSKTPQRESSEVEATEQVALPTSSMKSTIRSDSVLPLKKASRDIVIVIDPGHGGHDPGAIGEGGAQEKNIVLSIGRKLADLINQQPHMRAVLTRNGDYFVPLVDRLKLARKGKADLFVAIHADSYFNASSSGASVYALSKRGASSVAARWLSNRENHSELGGVDLRELEDQSLQLRSVLIDLAQTATITNSLRLGTSMLDALENVTRLHYARVEQAPFLVLKSPDIPSILVETGFLSNPKEEMKLKNPKYQTQIANALLDGIKRYVKKYSATL